MSHYIAVFTSFCVEVVSDSCLTLDYVRVISFRIIIIIIVVVVVVVVVVIIKLQIPVLFLPSACHWYQLFNSLRQLRILINLFRFRFISHIPVYLPRHRHFRHSSLLRSSTVPLQAESLSFPQINSTLDCSRPINWTDFTDSPVVFVGFSAHRFSF